MGRASKWLRALFGGRRPDPDADPPPSKKKWKFSKSRKETDHFHHSQQSIVPGADSGAAAAVRLRNHKGRGLKHSMPAAYVSQRGGAGYRGREVFAAVTIQSHFRAYLARQALRALRALVKLQALVRGQLWRKHMANQMQQLQALVRAQARTRAARTLNSEAHHSSMKSSQFKHTSRGTPQRIDQMIKAQSMKHGQHTISKRSGSKSSGNVLDDVEKSNLGRRTGEGSPWERRHNNYMHVIPMDEEKHDKILEVDTWRPRATLGRRHMFHSSDLSYSSDQYCQSFSTSIDSTARQTMLSGEVQSFGPKHDLDETIFYTPDSSPQVYYSGGTSRRPTFTPHKADGFRSGGLSGYSDHPNYMAYTESSKAKARSFSAPKQRPQYEVVYGYAHKVSSVLHANFTSKAYPGSGRLDRLGMPVGGDGGVLGGPWHRY